MSVTAKNIIVLIVFLLMTVSVSAAGPEIDVVYPKQGSLINAVDSSFILGSVTPGARLIINDTPVEIHKDGGFLAFLPLEPGDFVFRLTAVNETDSTILEWPVVVPSPRKSLPYDSLVIIDRSLSCGNAVLAAGDFLTVDMQATPNCRAYFSIPGYADSVPMSETAPRTQPYWGEAVFGQGAVPDSLKIRGFYQGFLEIDHRRLPDSTRILYHLTGPERTDLITSLIELPIEQFDMSMLKLLKFSSVMKIDSSQNYVKINADDFPRVVEFIDSIQTMRVGPGKGYLSIFQPDGVLALAVGAEGDWLKLKLSESQYGWVAREGVRFLDIGISPPKSFLRSLRTRTLENALEVEFPLAARHPYRIEEVDDRIIIIDLYGVISDTDWIRYDFQDKDIKLASWSQIEPERYRLKLSFKNPIWGYDSFYEGNILKLIIKKTPYDIGYLKYKTVIIDPGHSPDPGAIGPTGLTEAEANLNIAIQLKRQLEKRGARAIMTRADDAPLPLYDRPKIAKGLQADLFVSIHNNALPDGVNPFENNGTSVYYYHPHSLDLARSIQHELLRFIKLSDHGVYYGNLAVIRPTQYPAVLIECAFMMIPDQEAMLKSRKYQKKIAKAIRKGIEEFLEDKEDAVENE